MKGQFSYCENRHDTQAAALRESEERFRLVFENAPIGMVIANLKGRFMRVNQAMADILGYSVDQLSAMNFASITHPEDLTKDMFMVSELLHDKKPRFVMEKRYLRRDGEIINVTIHVSLVRDARRRPRYFIAQIVDITERKRYEQTIKHLAYHDPLTGLPNRVMLRDKLAVALAQARGNKDMLAVIFLDLDRFKVINDTLGHYIGDQALRLIAERLTASVRGSDIVARLGGDEFTVLLPGIGEEQDVFTVLSKLMEALQQPMRLADREFSVSASIGIALYPRDGQESEELLQVADKAMYAAKQRKGIES
ncbi:diguanylate cyclase domain-containing protein [Anaeroselena agilis]|uniref:Diguanylate cyclase n=1 Tax=Anaeroselena agilis TaxID=3063788 RepID=A0ABU3P0D2_9FIRM|nr:diguanylate cyclase [Selenomonadales bacterium 4137-cl]